MTGPLYLAAVSAGGGSTAQQQLFGVMCSLLKVAAQQANQQWTSCHMCWTVVMNLVVFQGEVQDSADEPRARQQSTAGAVAMVPWLVLLGRWWLHLAERLATTAVIQTEGSNRYTDTGSSLEAELQQQQQQQTLDVAGFAQAELARVTTAVAKAVLLSQHMLSQWLQSSEIAAALAAAGYLTDNICSQLQQLAEQGTQLQAAPGGPDPAALSAITPHLQAAGLALCTLPIPYACNNPHCTNLSGLSELHLVKGRSCKCSGCRVARYCSKACQQQHWKQHKPACKATSAAVCTQD